MIKVDTTPAVIEYVDDWFMGEAEIDLIGVNATTVVVLFNVWDLQSGIQAAAW